MRSRTQAAIFRLHAEGLSIDDIAAEVGCQSSSVRRVVGPIERREVQGDIVPARRTPAPIIPADSLAVSVQAARAAYLVEAAWLPRLTRDIATWIEAEIGSDDRVPQRLQPLLMAYGIATDKLATVIRYLRDMEAEGGDHIEAAWTVVVREDEDER